MTRDAGLALSEVRIAVRSGCATDPNKRRPIKAIVVSGGRMPMIWFGGEMGKHDGLAWVSGRATLRRLRDALTEMLEEDADG